MDRNWNKPGMISRAAADAYAVTALGIGTMCGFIIGTMFGFGTATVWH